MYYWIAKSDDGAFEDESTRDFETKKEAYEDMRTAALEKMKWNTEYNEDFFELEVINYEVKFSQSKIIHNSYSGEYTYEIKERKITQFCIDVVDKDISVEKIEKILRENGIEVCGISNDYGWDASEYCK